MPTPPGNELNAVSPEQRVERAFVSWTTRLAECKTHLVAGFRVIANARIDPSYKLNTAALRTSRGLTGSQTADNRRGPL